MFPFMRSKVDRLECTGSDQDRKLVLLLIWFKMIPH